MEIKNNISAGDCKSKYIAAGKNYLPEFQNMLVASKDVTDIKAQDLNPKIRHATNDIALIENAQVASSDEDGMEIAYRELGQKFATQKEFEAEIYALLWQEAFKTIDYTPEFNGGNTGELFMSLYIEDIAKQAYRRGDIELIPSSSYIKEMDEVKDESSDRNTKNREPSGENY